MLPEPFRAMDPDDEVGWHAVADWLEEHDSPQRAELVRLTRLLRHGPRVPDAARHEDRLRELLAAGVEPCVATLTNSIGMEFVYVPAGVFLLGSPEDEPERYEVVEGPMHEVEITRGFYLGRYQVTQAEYEAVIGKNPSYFSVQSGGKAIVERMDTRRFPVERVSHEDALSFCKKLSQEDKVERWSYRLPTEAEWEYACRGGAGSTTPFHFGNTVSTDQANFDGKWTYGASSKGESRKRTCEVGSFAPNAFGLYDMHGNVWEWCADGFAQDYYGRGHAKDPQGPQSGDARVMRGGSWFGGPGDCRAASRGWNGPADPFDVFGCRVLLCLD